MTTLRHINGMPDEVYDPPAAHGDPLTLVTLRGHVGRCQDCTEDGPCATGKLLVSAFLPVRRYWAPTS